LAGALEIYFVSTLRSTRSSQSTRR